jgi:hypothetical protein
MSWEDCPPKPGEVEGMQVYCNGSARIKHKTTGSIYEVKSDELDWDAVGGDERQMGPEIHYEAAVEHPELGMLVWSLWEYPSGIENHKETNVGKHELIEDFYYGLNPAIEVDYDVDYDLPDDPFTIFMDSQHQTSKLLSDHGSRDDGTYLLNRMIFSHHVTALEAYLADTLMKAVLADKAAMCRLMKGDKELAKERFSLEEIARASNLVDTRVREYLLSIRYHNLQRVNFLYKTALLVPILDLAQDKNGLFTAITLRHDCVHRNGIDKDGNAHTVFTEQYVQNTADLIRVFVEKINRQLQAVDPAKVS